MSTSSVRGKNQRGDQQKQQHQLSHRDNKMSTLCYLDSSRDPQANDAASVQSSFFYASLAIVEAFQGVKATCDTALKTGDMGIFKKREVTCLRC